MSLYIINTKNQMYQKKYTQFGFTLFEMLIVISMISVLAVIAAPSLNSAFERQRNKESTQNIVNALKEARTESLLRHADVKVVYETDKLKVILPSLGSTKSEEIIRQYVIKERAPIETRGDEVIFKPNKKVDFKGSTGTSVTYTTYCDKNKQKVGRKVIIDVNGNIFVNKEGSLC